MTGNLPSVCVSLSFVHDFRAKSWHTISHVVQPEGQSYQEKTSDLLRALDESLLCYIAEHLPNGLTQISMNPNDLDL